jgi:hypothetical protein
MSLHIGAMMPDRALDESALIKAITKVAIDLAALGNQQIQKRKPAVDIMFLLPSHLENAGFNGLRMRAFDAADQRLRFESAVPEKMVTSAHAERYVTAIMLDAIDAAAEFFNEKHILFNAVEHSALVDFVTLSDQRLMN